MRILEAPILLNAQIVNPPLVISSCGLFWLLRLFFPHQTRMGCSRVLQRLLRKLFAARETQKWWNWVKHYTLSPSLLGVMFPVFLKCKFIIAVSKLINQLCFGVLQDSVVDPAVLFSMHVARKRILSFNIAFITASFILTIKENNTGNASTGKTEDYTAPQIGRCSNNFLQSHTHKTKGISFPSAWGDDKVGVNRPFH